MILEQLRDRRQNGGVVWYVMLSHSEKYIINAQENIKPADSSYINYQALFSHRFLHYPCLRLNLAEVQGYRLSPKYYWSQ